MVKAATIVLKKVLYCMLRLPCLFAAKRTRALQYHLIFRYSETSSSFGTIIEYRLLSPTITKDATAHSYAANCTTWSYLS